MARRSAMVVVELLVVLAILALASVLFSGLADVRSRALSNAARVVASRLVVERSDALLRGVAPCIDARTITAIVQRSTVLITWPPRGLLFTPDGLPRTCDGGGVGNTTILLEHRGRQAAVIVSSLGRVRWELR